MIANFAVHEAVFCIIIFSAKIATQISSYTMIDKSSAMLIVEREIMLTSLRSHWQAQFNQWSLVVGP
jgi:hypothetical protein